MVLNMSQYVFLFVNVNGWQKLFVNAMAHNLNMWWWSASAFLGLRRSFGTPSPIRPLVCLTARAKNIDHIYRFINYLRILSDKVKVKIQKTQHMPYFQKARVSRISIMIFWPVNHTNNFFSCQPDQTRPKSSPHLAEFPIPSHGPF